MEIELALALEPPQLLWNDIHVWKCTFTRLAVTRDGEVLVAAWRVVLQNIMKAHGFCEVEPGECWRPARVDETLSTGVLRTRVVVITISHHTHGLAVLADARRIAEHVSLWGAYRAILCILVNALSLCVETSDALAWLPSQEGATLSSHYMAPVFRYCKSHRSCYNSNHHQNGYSNRLALLH